MGTSDGPGDDPKVPSAAALLMLSVWSITRMGDHWAPCVCIIHMQCLQHNPIAPSQLMETIHILALVIAPPLLLWSTQDSPHQLSCLVGCTRDTWLPSTISCFAIRQLHDYYSHSRCCRLHCMPASPPHKSPKEWRKTHWGSPSKTGYPKPAQLQSFTSHLGGVY